MHQKLRAGRRLALSVGIAFALVAYTGAARAADVEMPRVLDSRLKLDLIADAPQIVTPTGIAIDRRGCVYVIECHTHFRPEGYEGPKADRIRILWDTEDDHVDHITTFYEGTTATMNLAFHPDGSLYVATRSEIFRLRDTDRDDVADERTRIAHLETTGNYPHNGLSGFAFDFFGNVYFGFGENLGADYKLIGSDGAALLGGGEGGNIYRCRADGSGVHRVATGFWNPFHLCFDAFGRLFAVDNDPDSRPPCRLLHIVEDGDYGYRFRNGRKGLHPFTSWNGELPGTLPMVAGTGEAPSGILAYESDNLPEEYLGSLLCTSWGDHRIDRFRLQSHGSSFLSTAEPIVVGGENFRPVGIALAPDGSLFISDWVDKSYQLHGKGRIWRLRNGDKSLTRVRRQHEVTTSGTHGPDRIAAGRQTGLHGLKLALSGDDRQRAIAWQALTAGHDISNTLLEEFEREKSPVVQQLALTLFLDPAQQPAARQPADSLPTRATKMIKPLARDFHAESLATWTRGALVPGRPDDPAMLRSAESSDPFQRRALLTALKRSGRLAEPSHDWDQASSPAVRLLALHCRRETTPKEPASLAQLRLFLDDADPDVRFAAIQWAAEEGLKEFRPQLADGLATKAATRRLFEGYLAGLSMLDGTSTKAWDETGLEPYIAQLLLDDKAAPTVRRHALRMLRPDHAALTTAVLQGFLASDDPAMQFEAVRTLRERQQDDARELLRSIAGNVQQATALRAEAIVGLRADDPLDRKLLWALVDEKVHTLHDEALRSLRGVEPDEEETERLTSAAKEEPALGDLVAKVLAPKAPPANAPSTEDGAAWLALLEKQGTGDAAAGERIFFHPQAAGCFKCHQMEGRGGRVGPDLTATGKTLSRRRLVESILRPSQEVAPQFVTWTIVTRDGQTLTGVLVSEAVDGAQTYADAAGKPFTVRPAEIETREQARKSIMPDGLHERLTLTELRDLLAYLSGKP